MLSLLVLCLFCGRNLSADEAPSAKPPAELEKAVAQLKAVLRPGQGQVHHVDAEPTVAIGEMRGYRVVVRNTWKEHTYPVQQQAAAAGRGPGEDGRPFVTKHSHWNFVLFPAGAKLPADAAKKISWPEADDRVKSFHLPVALGEGYGCIWFSNTTIYHQHFLRDQLKLAGGDDRIQLLVRGLSVKDEGTATRNSVQMLFVQLGDKGFDALNQEIRTNADPSYAIRSLAYFRDAKSTDRLVELHGSPVRQIQQAADYALVCRPFRPEAKQAYLDMLGNPSRVYEAIEACRQFDWKDSLPQLKQIVEKPSSLGAYRGAFKASRELAGKPISPKLLAAEKTIEQRAYTDRGRDQADLTAARQAILDADDVEAATFVGISLATFLTKGNITQVQREGIEILRVLPRATVDKMLNQLAKGLQDESHRNTVAKLLQQVL